MIFEERKQDLKSAERISRSHKKENLSIKLDNRSWWGSKLLTDFLPAV